MSTPAAPSAAPFPSKFQRVIGHSHRRKPSPAPNPVRSIILLAAAGFAEPGAGARDRFAAAADRQRLSHHRGRRRDRASRLMRVTHGSIQFVVGPIGDRFGKYRTVAIASAVAAVLVACAASRIVAAATRAGAAGDRRRRRLGDPGLDGLSRRRDARRPPATDPGPLRLGLHSRPDFRPGRGRRARRSVRLAQRLLHARRHCSRWRQPVSSSNSSPTRKRASEAGSDLPTARLRRRLCRRPVQSLRAHHLRSIGFIEGAWRGARSPISAQICICASA